MSSGDDVHEIDIVAQLGDRGASHYRIQAGRKRIRAQPKEAGLILIDHNSHLPRRLHPVEIYSSQIAVGAKKLAEPQGNRPYLGQIRTTDAKLHRPPNWWS